MQHVHQMRRPRPRVVAADVKMPHQAGPRPGDTSGDSPDLNIQPSPLTFPAKLPPADAHLAQSRFRGSLQLTRTKWQLSPATRKRAAWPELSRLPQRGSGCRGQWRLVKPKGKRLSCHPRYGLLHAAHSGRFPTSGEPPRWAGVQMSGPETCAWGPHGCRARPGICSWCQGRPRRGELGALSTPERPGCASPHLGARDLLGPPGEGEGRPPKTSRIQSGGTTHPAVGAPGRAHPSPRQGGWKGGQRAGSAERALSFHLPAQAREPL